MLATLMDIVTAQSLIKKSSPTTEKSLHSLPPNPIDLKYNELSSDIRLIDSTHPHYEIILKYIKETRNNDRIKLENIWEVRRNSEDASFSSFATLDNHRLLWHGTNVAVVAAIIKNGLRIMPSVNGGRVGRGIYFANELQKSFDYVRVANRDDGKRVGILFLAEVALGKMKVIHR